MYLKAWCELWASEILVPVTVFILFFDSHGFSLNSSFMAAHSWGSSLYKSLYHVISTVGCTDIICEWKLYFQTVSNPSLHRGHLRGTFVHGLLGVNLCAVAIKSFTALGHWDCWGSTDFALFLLLPFVRQIEQRLPTFKQNPKGLFECLTTRSCRMWVPICWTSSEGLLMGSGSDGYLGQRHSWCSVPNGKSLSSQIKQASSKCL